jgi:Zn-dependent protease
VRRSRREVVRSGLARRRLSARIASPAGIDVRVHVSFLLLVVLVAVASAAPDGPGALSSAIWLVAIFTCVVLHELSHSLVARRHGIPVREIELLPIGGVSKLSRSPEDPRVELRIAAAGPAASLGVAAALAVVAVAAGVSLWPPTLYGGGLLARLVWANVLLAGFNLVPAFPLDGGRVLRAALEARTDRATATATAARIGRWFALAMVAIGVLVNVWLVLIGAFVWVASRAEERTAAIHDQLSRLRVGDLAEPAPRVLSAAAPAAAEAPPVWSSGPRVLPVVDPTGRSVGLVSTAALSGAPPGATVGDVTDTSIPTLEAGLSIEASGLLSGDPALAVVVDRGRVVGTVTARAAVALVERLVRERAARRSAP